MRYFALFILLLLNLSRAQAAPAADGLMMVGLADFVQLRSSYYIGALYLPAPAADPALLRSGSGRRRMEIRVSADRWTSRRFSSQWMQALILNVDANTLSRFDDAIVEFNNLPHEALVRGDQIVVASSRKGLVSVSINGTEMFTVEKPGFFEVLLAAWIGPKPPSSEFKQVIMSSVDPKLLSKFNVLQPTVQRNAEVAGWLGGQELMPETEQEQEEAPAASGQPVVDNTAAIAASVAAPVSVAMDNPAPVTAKEMRPLEREQKVPGDRATRLALAPTASTLMPVAEPAIDPEIERLQRETLLKLYRSSIIKRALRKVKYPKSAVRRKQQGNVMLDLTVNRAGGIVSLVESEPSRYGVLNTAAVDAVRAVGKLPPVPAMLEGDNILISIPVRFKLQ